jgi:hypothetical protein
MGGSKLGCHSGSFFGCHFHTLVHNEGGDFPARSFRIEVIYGLPQEVLEPVGSQRFVIAVIAGLTHPGFEMSGPNFRIPARVSG